MLVIYLNGEITLFGRKTNLHVVQRGDRTVVYTKASRLYGIKYKEHKMPHIQYTLTHHAPMSGTASRAAFESDLQALVASLTLGAADNRMILE